VRLRWLDVTSVGSSENVFVFFFLSAVVSDVFYFLNIYSHGKLPSHCEQRFLPCEIGCVKYSLKDGIMADFHHFIDPGEFQGRETRSSSSCFGVRGRHSTVTYCCPD